MVFFHGAAPDGEAAEFASAGGFAGAQSDYAYNDYIARRVENVGWVTSSVSIPATLDGQTTGVVTSFDLAKQLVRIYYLTGEKAGSTGLLVSEDLAAAPALSFGEIFEYRNIPFEPERGLKEPADESPSFSQVVVPSNLSTSYEEPKLYEISGVGGSTEALRLVSVVGPKEEPINAVVGLGSNVRGGLLFHAISNDGAEVFFTRYEREVTGPSYVRVNGSETLPLDGLFQGASEDGSKVFLSGGSGELYMDAIDGEPGQVAVTETVPIAPAGQSNTFLRSSDDGSHVYFLSTGVLAGNENENHEKAEVGRPNMYVYDTVTEELVFIARAEPGGEIAEGEVEAQVSGCPSVELGEIEEPGCEGGRFFVFTSTAHITPGDTAGGRQVFEYDAATGRLVRVSTGEGGYDDNGNGGSGNATIAAPNFGTPRDYTQTELFADGTRAVSDDGSTVVFSTSGVLSPRAVNDLTGRQSAPLDVYEWRDGQVGLISTGHSLASDEQPAITPSGRDVFFTSTEGILPQDTDGLRSLYDARIDGGFPAPPVPAGGCNGDSCQGPPSVPELLGAPASATFSGLGNPTPAAPTPAVKPKPKSKPKQCGKGQVKKKNECVKRRKKAGRAARSDRRIKS